MLLTVFLAIVLCAAVSLMLLSAVAFVQKKEFFSSAPKEAQEAILPREKELFYGARTIGWTLMIFSILMILGTGAVSIWDGFRSGFGFWQFFTRFVLIFTIYKVYDMVCFDYFLLMKFHFFQYYYPETQSALVGRKYGFNIKSQLLKLLVIFPAVSAIAAWICTLIG
ncbi:MAG: hypothetical protein IJ210_09195 [Clostridia bacterium]|nr:hypothetical protein [Clostridia bacterium]